MNVTSRRVSICSLAVALIMPATGVAAFTSYVRVASDGFHFLADNPGVFFVPMGVNYTAADQGWAPDYFSDCYFDEAKLQRDFAAMAALNLNTCKVKVLWPPDQRMVEIVPSFTALDAVDPAPSVLLRSVTSSEPDDGDIVITPEGRVFVRADRDGKGAGRTYTIVYTATDGSGNESSAAAEVTVPHDQGR